MEHQIVTVLVEPNLLVREGLIRILAGTQFEVRAHSSNLQELRLSESPSMFMIPAPDQASAGENAILRIRAEHPAVWIVCLACSNDPALCRAALRAGANGFLTQQLSADALVKSLELVSRGLVALPTDLLKEFVGQPHQPHPAPLPDTSGLKLANMRHTGQLPGSGRAIPLSAREMNVLECIRNGHSNKHIARQYDLAEATVKVHVKAILRKIGAANRTQAAIWAMSQAQPKSNKVIYPEPSDVQ